MWKKNEIREGHLTSKKWSSFAKEWNEKHSMERGYTLPISSDGLIGALEGDPKESTKREYVITLFEGREFTKK